MKNTLKKIFCIFLALTALLALSNCTPTKDSEKDSEKDSGKTKETREITDLTDRKVEIPKTIKSIVCVNVSALRFVSYIGAQNLVSGVEQNEKDPNPAKLFSYINKETFANLPHTGDNGQTYDESIIALSPDVIITATDKDSANELSQKLQIPVVAFPAIDSVFDENIAKTLTLLGEVFGKEQKAGELISFIDNVKTDLNDRTKDIDEGKKPYVYVGGINYKGSRDIGGTEALYAPLSAINAINLADSTSLKGAITIDKEQILEWNPDILFVDFSGIPLIKEDYKKNPDFYNSLNAVKNSKVYSQIPFRYNAVNIEIALADAYYAGKIIFPESFSDIDPIKKADEIYQAFLGQNCYEILKDAGYEFKEMKDMIFED